MTPRIHTVGLDIAKDVFQIHCVDNKGTPVTRRRLQRCEVASFFQKLSPCVVGIEACASAHHWARLFRAAGHDVKLMPTQYVKPYVKVQKNDAADAEAICEAVQRPNMRFVPIKTRAQQALTMLHRAHETFSRHERALANALRAHLAEFGVVRPAGKRGTAEILQFIANLSSRQVPKHAHTVLRWFADELRAAHTRVLECEKHIVRAHKDDERCARLTGIPGIGPITASAIVAAVGDAKHFSSSRHFASWIGVVPRQHSSGGKIIHGGITRRGNAYIRRLLYMGAMTTARRDRNPDDDIVRWAMQLRARKRYRVALIAVANKLARIVWALLTRKETFQPRLVAA